MAGRYRRQLATTDTHPYWQYVAVMNQSTRPSHAQMDRLLPEAQQIFRSTSVIAQYSMAKAGLGVAILPCFMAKEAPELKPILEEQLTLTRSFWLAAQPERKRLTRVEAVWLELRRLVEEQQALLMGGW